MTLIGKQITSYVIKEKLGEGGMGEVYLAEDTRLGRQVALKFLSDEIAEKKHAVDRFLREARAASSLNHPNICTIHDIGEYEGCPFLVMELLEGQSLADRIREQRLSPREVLELGIQIAEGLEAAHSRGIIHRDIKPGNIQVSEKGRIKILDFGLAKLGKEDQDSVPQQSIYPTEDPHLTTSGMTVGTVAYMSPEQARGKKVDARSDIFSFGAVLYEMATGHRAFAGNSAAEMFDAILNRRPVSPIRVNPDLPDDLERILLKTLEKDPDLRYQSVADLKSDMKRLVRDISATQPPAAEQSQPATGASPAIATHPESTVSSDAEIAMTLIRRHRRMILVGVVIVLAAAATLFYAMSGRKPVSSEIPKIDSLAVMYFENLTDRTDSDSTARMLSNLLTTELSRSQNLNVVSSQRLYDISRQLGKGEAQIDRSMATTVAERAKVGTMVLGQVARLGTKWVATTELVDVSSGRVLGSQKTEGRSMEDIFRMVEDLGQQIRSYIPQSLAAKTGGQSLAQQITHSVEAYRSFVRGESYLQRQEFQEAAEEYRRAAEADPNFAMAYYKLSIASNWLSDGKTSEEAINNALRLTDRLPSAYQDLARSYSFYTQDLFSRAIPLLESVLKRDPDNKEALYILSEIYMHSVRDVNPLRAAQVMEKLLESDPDFHLVYGHLGLAYALLGDFKKGEEIEDRWAAQNNGTEAGDRAMMDALQNHLAEALQRSEPMPQFMVPNIHRAYWSIGLSRFDKAKALLESGLPEDDWSRLMKVYLFALMDCYRGKFQSAEERLGQLPSPQFASAQGEGGEASAAFAAWKLKAELSLLKGDLQDAQLSIRRMLDRVPESPGVAYFAGHLFLQSGDLQKANECLTRFGQLRKDTANSTIDVYEDALRGEILLAQGKATNALEFLQKAIDSGKLYMDFFSLGALGSGRIRHSLGSSYLAVGQEAKAIEAFELFLNRDLDRMDHPILYLKTLSQVAGLKMKAGDREGARKLLEKVLENWGNADWDIPEVREARAQLKRF